MGDTSVAVSEVHYPETDGKPMGETDTHRDQMMDLIHCLREWFREAPDVYVAGNLLLYYEEGNPQASLAPDVFVARGVDDHSRRTYRVWEEGKGPDLVIEITSRSTRIEDLGSKRVLYAELDVSEYLIFDPLCEWQAPPLAAYRLENGEYVRVETASGRVASDVTDLEFGIIEGCLRVFDPSSGKMLLTPSETERELEQTERKFEREAEVRRQAEERERLLAEGVERLRRQLEARDGGESG